MKKICLVINARVNSSRCHKKMIAPIGNTCLIEILIKKLKRSAIEDKNIFICSPDHEIEEITNKYNINFIKRSKESNDEEFDIKKIMEWHKELNNSYDYFMLINPCCPFLKIKTINNLYKLCNEDKYDRVFGIINSKNYYFDEDNKPINFIPGTLNTKFVKPLKVAAHCLYFMKLTDIEKDNYLGKFKDNLNPFLFLMEEEEVYDIDYQYQFDMIKCYIENNQEKIYS